MPSEVEQIPAADFDLLLRYYEEEPWGPSRDNIHAAIIAREVRRTRMKDPRQQIDLQQFMLMAPAKRRRASVHGFADALRGMAGGVKKHVSEVKTDRPKRRKRVKQ